MSSALAYALAEHRKRLDELERKNQELEQRLKVLENRPRPGRPRKDEER